MTGPGRIPAQDEIRDQGRCSHGYRSCDGAHCGEPSEPGAPFGDCPRHAEESRALVAQFFGGAAEAGGLPR